MRPCFALLLGAALAIAGEPLTWHGSPGGGVLTLPSSPYSIETEAGGGMEFAVLRLPGAGLAGEVGDPGIPVYRRLIEVPFGADVTVAVKVGAVETQVLDHPLMPVQPPVPKSGPAPEFALSPKAYAADAAVSQPGARVSEIVEMRGHRIAVVEVFPVGYAPAQGSVQITREMQVDVTWSGADWLKTQAMHRRYASPAFSGRLDGVVLGTERFALDAGPVLPVGYLVIVPDAWQANVQPLAEWRRRKGYHVFVRNLTEVGGGTANAVKAYIQNAYDNWPIPPSFVLLVGDVDQIGYFTGQGQGNPPTDLDFALLEGSDYFPDVDLSRASVANAAQLDSLVAKIVGYEKRTLSGGTNWLKKQYFIASADAGNHQVTENTHAYVMRKLRPLGVECDSLWLYYTQGTPINTAINGGRSWVTYSGHGGENCWADPTPEFDLAAVHALANTDLIPYVQTYACLSGNFSSTSYPECFSEAWIRNGRRGALAHIASTVTSYWTEDDTLERRVFDFMFDSSYTWIMGGFNKAKVKFYEQMGNNSTTRRYFEMYNLMGDGGVDLYSLEPAQLTVTHPPVIPVGAYPLNVTVNSGGPVAGALVCAMAKSDTSVFASAYTNAGGSVVLNLTTLVPDSIFVTVTGHNLAPYLGAALALPSSGPYVMYLRHAIDDSTGGNNDHVINPGETINLPMWLKNWGNAQAQSVRTWLRTNDQNITLLDSLKTFGNIGAGDSAYSGTAGFRFAVAPSCTNRYSLGFTVVSRDANDSIWQSPLYLLVGAPFLLYAGNQADDPPPGGNGNGMIDPGETGELIVTLRNTGLGNATGVTATLRSGDARLVVLDSLGSFGDIPAETTGTNDGDRFGLRADVSIPRETEIPCTLVVRTGGQTLVRVFALGIGIIRSMDPIPDGPRAPARYWAYDATDVLYSEAPSFAWVEINGLGTRLSLGDDETRVVSLPASFGPWVWYGQSFSQLSICGNGWVSPGSTTSTAYNNVVLPDNSDPGMFAVCWDDIYPSAGAGLFYYHDSANHRFVVEWDSMPYFSARNVFDDYQVIIYDTTIRTQTGDNVVEMQYLTANGYTSMSVGMEDPQSDTGINYLANGTYHRGAATLTPGMAIRYTTNPPRPRVGMVENGENRGLPTRLSLLGSAPNPFRQRTSLSFAVPQAMRVRLGVFDQSGRKVASLFDGVAQPGTHTAVWNGCDSRGRRAARGVYFYRLESDRTSIVHKAVMVE